MPNLVHFAHTMTERMPEIEINLRLKKFYKNRPIARPAQDDHRIEKGSANIAG